MSDRVELATPEEIAEALRLARLRLAQKSRRLELMRREICRRRRASRVGRRQRGGD